MLKADTGSRAVTVRAFCISTLLFRVHTGHGRVHGSKPSETVALMAVIGGKTQ